MNKTLHIKQSRRGEGPQTREHLVLLEVATVHDDAPLRLVPQHLLRMGMQALLLQFVLAAECHHLRLCLHHLTPDHLQAIGRIAVVTIEKTQIWCRHELHAVVTGHGRRTYAIVQFLDDDVPVVLEHLH